MADRYKVNEIFYSIQGEGNRAGEPSVFLRFSNCNMQCQMEEGPKSPGGFDCDTEFESGRFVSADEIRAWIMDEVGKRPIPEWIVMTGGEPGLQVDQALCDLLHIVGFRLAIETNGSIFLGTEGVTSERVEELEESFSNLDTRDRLQVILNDAFPFDWITVSPKVAEHAIRQLWAHEVKYVRGWGQMIPKTRVRALHHYLSPAFNGLSTDPRAIDWCNRLILEHPPWKLTGQLHKLINVR